MPEIAIVSDNPSEYLLICQALEHVSWTLTDVHMDSSTIAELRRLTPDVIIIGASLSLNDGLQTCRQIRTGPLLVQTPILLLSVPGRLTLDNIGLEINDLINIPFDAIELHIRIRNLLRTKLTQDELHQTRQNQNDLFEMLVHDIGNMVTIMTSALSFYHYVPTTSPAAAQSVYDAYESSLILGQMLNDLLDVTRLENKAMPIRRHATHVPELLQATLDLIQSAALEKKIIVDLLINKGTESFAHIDKGLLHRMVTNLMLNAVSYSPPSSHITVQFVTTRVKGIAQRFQIMISDQGPGISPEQQLDIFDKTRLGRYYAEKKERVGHGLGLIFCRLAVEAHGGTITVHSVLGQGATFTLDLPYNT